MLLPHRPFWLAHYAHGPALVSVFQVPTLAQEGSALLPVVAVPTTCREILAASTPVRQAFRALEQFAGPSLIERFEASLYPFRAQQSWFHGLRRAGAAFRYAEKGLRQSLDYRCHGFGCSIAWRERMLHGEHPDQRSFAPRRFVGRLLTTEQLTPYS